MGAEALPAKGEILTTPPRPFILGLQPAALIDHVARVDWSLLDQVPGDRGGSIPVAIEELEYILREVKTHILGSPSDPSPVKMLAGGSVANTIRGLSAGFGVSCGIIGACGDDEQGRFFVSNMSFNGVNLSRLRMKKGPTGQCVCLVDELGNRTMRPCLSTAVKIHPDDLIKEDFKDSKWLVMRYTPFNMEIIQAAIHIAKQEGLFISLDLASFEDEVIAIIPLNVNEHDVDSYMSKMVRNFRQPLLQLLESGNIDLCFANEDEATELVKGEQKSNPEAALEFLSKHCQWAVVTLGANGCIAKHGKEMVRVPATGESKAVDATGAGDLFASGFLYGLVKGLSLEECCKVGACSGGSVVRSLGGEVSSENWQWTYKQMQGKGLPVPDIRN